MESMLQIKMSLGLRALLLILVLSSCATTVGAVVPAGWIRVDQPGTFQVSGQSTVELYAIGSGLYAQDDNGYKMMQFNPFGNWVSVSGLPGNPVLPPSVIFNDQLYSPCPNGTSFDINRTPDVMTSPKTWTKVVVNGFSDSTNHQLGCLIVYNNNLLAVTDWTRTSGGSFGDYNTFGHGIQVWESSTGDPGSWTQVNVDGFGTEVTIPTGPGQTKTFRSNQDFGSACVYHGYLYVGTKAHYGGQVWRYDGTGLNGWTDVSPPTMGAATGPFGVPPSRAEDMLVFRDLLWLAEGFPTANLDTYDGTSWQIVVPAEPDPVGPFGHPFDLSSVGLSSLAVLGTKIYVATENMTGLAEVWGYEYPTPTITVITSSDNPSTYGQSVTFTASVTSDEGTPTGNVQFVIDGANLGTPVSLNGTGHAASQATSSLSVGNHPVTANYLGSSSFATSSGTLTDGQQVNQALTTSTLTSSHNPSFYGQSVTFTATVTITSPGSGTLTGNVEFFDGATSLGTALVTAPTLSTSALTVGSHNITARYLGGTNFKASTSDIIYQGVNKASTTTSVSTSKSPSVYSQLAPTFTATVAAVAPGAGTPTGTVTFKDGTKTLGPGTLSGGSWTFTPSTTALALGAHSITAVYAGDTNFIGSTSPVLTQTVNPPPKITAYVPNNGKRGATAFKFVISGSAFQNGATVSLTKSGVPAIDATGVTVSSQKNSITCTLKIPSSAPTGSRSVLVKNPDEGTSTVSGFTVK